MHSLKSASPARTSRYQLSAKRPAEVFVAILQVPPKECAVLVRNPRKLTVYLERYSSKSAEVKAGETKDLHIQFGAPNFLSLGFKPFIVSAAYVSLKQHQGMLPVLIIGTLGNVRFSTTSERF